MIPSVHSVLAVFFQRNLISVMETGYQLIWR